MRAAIPSRFRTALAAPREPPVISGVLWQVTRLLLYPFMFGYLRARRVGHHRIPKRGPVLVVCNHVGFIDPPVVAGAIAPRRVWIMSKAELYRSKPLAWWMSRCGAFPVNRASADTRSIRTARELLARGECLLSSPKAA